MKSPKAQKILAPNPLHGGRKKGEKMVVIPVEEFDEIEVLPPPSPHDWMKAPGMPYDDGLSNARAGKLVHWTPEEKALLAEAQSRGDSQAVVLMMKAKSQQAD